MVQIFSKKFHSKKTGSHNELTKAIETGLKKIYSGKKTLNNNLLKIFNAIALSELIKIIMNKNYDFKEIDCKIFINSCIAIFETRNDDLYMNIFNEQYNLLKLITTNENLYKMIKEEDFEILESLNFNFELSEKINIIELIQIIQKIRFTVFKFYDKTDANIINMQNEYNNSKNEDKIKKQKDLNKCKKKCYHKGLFLKFLNKKLIYILDYCKLTINTELTFNVRYYNICYYILNCDYNQESIDEYISELIPKLYEKRHINSKKKDDRQHLLKQKSRKNKKTPSK